MTKVNDKHVGWGFRLWWVLASAVGVTVSIAAGGFEDGTVGFVADGAVVGILQWLVLRQHLSRAGWWVLASTVGGVVGGAVGGEAGLAVGIAVFGVSTGGVWVWILELVGIVVGIGIAQWLVLRQHLSRAGWWVLDSAVGWAVGFMAATIAVFVLQGLAYFGALGSAGIWVGLAVGGAVYGAITGGALVWLLGQPKLEE